MVVKVMTQSADDGVPLRILLQLLLLSAEPVAVVEVD